MSEQPHHRTIDAIHGDPRLGWEVMRKAEEQRRPVDARNLAQREAAVQAAAATPPPSPESPPQADPSPEPAPPPPSPEASSTSVPQRRGPIVVNVGKVKAARAQRAADRARLDRIEAALDRALREMGSEP